MGSWSLKKPPPTPGRSLTWFAPLSLTRRSGKGSPVTSSTTVDVGPRPPWSRGPGTNVKPPSAVATLSRIETSLDPSLAMTRSGRPLRLATVMPTGSVPVKKPLPPFSSGPNWYVHDPSATQTSTQAAYVSRNYTIAPAGAWSERVEAQGFAAPVWVDASGNPVGTAFMLTDDATRTMTIALPEAQFGTPGSGWAFTVVLTGQDGFSPDQARAFTQPAGAFTFGVCAPGETSPICSVDPSTVPKAVDVITPTGVSQATELDPTRARW